MYTNTKHQHVARSTPIHEHPSPRLWRQNRPLALCRRLLPRPPRVPQKAQEPAKGYAPSQRPPQPQSSRPRHSTATRNAQGLCRRCAGQGGRDALYVASTGKWRRAERQTDHAATCCVELADGEAGSESCVVTQEQVCHVCRDAAIRSLSPVRWAWMDGDLVELFNICKT